MNALRFVQLVILESQIVKIWPPNDLLLYINCAFSFGRGSILIGRVLISVIEFDKSKPLKIMQGLNLCISSILGFPCPGNLILQKGDF